MSYSYIDQLMGGPGQDPRQQTSGYAEWARYEQSVRIRAVSLMPDNASPYMNVAPYMDLIRRADALGLDVVVRPTPNAGDGRG